MRPAGPLPAEHFLDDNRAESITAAHVLGHTSGLPNWRGDDLPLRTHFAPGGRFSYSGEGLLYLQLAVEAVTGEKLHALVDRLILQPFGMAQSGFVWEWRFDGNRAAPHDEFGRPALGWKYGEGNASFSLLTTASDYARFLVHVLDGSLLRPETARLWLREHVRVRHAGPQSLGADDQDAETGVSWGLGWGLEPGEGTFFHWGNNGPFRAFTLGSAATKDAAVFFMNGGSGLALMPELVSALFPGSRPSLAWLGYGRHDSPARRILQAARTRSVDETWDEIVEAGLGRDDRIWIARGLAASGMAEAGARLRDRIDAAPGKG